MTIEIGYNPEVYDSIIETGRFSPLNIDSLELITSAMEASRLQKVGRDFRFTSEKSIFPDTELHKILQVHSPAEANAYYYYINNNVLNLSFLKK